MKLIILSLFVVAPMYSMEKEFKNFIRSTIKKRNNSFSTDEKVKRLHGDKFFKKHPTAHQLLYGLFHGIGTVGIMMVTVGTAGYGTYKASYEHLAPYYDHGKEQAIWRAIPLAGIAGSTGGIMGFCCSKKILDKGWEALNFPRPDNAHDLAIGSAVIGSASLALGVLIIFLR